MRKLSLVAGLFAAALTGAFATSSQAAQAGQKFENWEIVCGEGGKGACAMQQIVKNGEGRPALVAAIGFAPDPQGQKVPKMTVVTPLGVILPAGLGLQVDDTQAARVPFLQCAPNGCRTVINLEADGLKKLKGGREIRFTYEQGDGKVATLPVSLSGFNKAYDSLQK